MTQWFGFYASVLVNISIIYLLYWLMVLFQKNPLDKNVKYRDEHISNYYYPVLPYNYDSWVDTHLKVQKFLENKKINIYNMEWIFFFLFMAMYLSIIIAFALNIPNNLSFFLSFGFTAGLILSLGSFVFLLGCEFVIGTIYDKRITPKLTKMLSLLINEEQKEFLEYYNKQNRLIKWCAKHCFSKNDLFSILILHKNLSKELKKDDSKKSKKINKI